MTPARTEQGFSSILAILAAVAAVSLAAHVSVPVPGSPVPQSLQTLAVVLVGAWLGPRDATLALCLYIVVGALGAPVFADGAGGATHVVGPTMGYLAGFVAGAALMGWWVRQAWGWGVVGSFAGAVVVHSLIFTLGWGRLGMLVGPIVAWETGVAPFLAGGVAKSALAALVWAGIRRWARDLPVPHQDVGAGGAPSAEAPGGDLETDTGSK